MKTSVVILNWNGADMMRRFLPCVVEYSKGAEVVVADNDSKDDSLQLLASEFPSVHTIVLNKNYGFAGGYNRALEQIDSQYTVLLNSDVEVTERWLEPLIDFLDKNPEVAACQPKLRSVEKKERFEYAGAAGGFIDRFGYPFCRGRLFDSVETDEGQYDDIADIHWATGACMVLRTKVFKECGGFDERFFAHNEEIDLCWRMRLYGHRICVVPQSVVYHLGGGTLPQGNPRKVYLNFRNNLTMLFKNLPDSELGKVMAMRFFLDRLAVFQCLCKRDLKGAKAILTARKDFAKWKSEYIPVRKEIQSKAISSERMTMSFSVLFKYFLFGKKKYSQLRG